MNVFSKEDCIRLGEAHFSRSTAAAVVTGKMFLSFPSSVGKRFRSQNEVRNYLQDIGSNLNPALFCFNARGQAGMPRTLKKGGLQPAGGRQPGKSRRPLASWAPGRDPTRAPLTNGHVYSVYSEMKVFFLPSKTLSVCCICVSYLHDGKCPS